MSVLLYCGCVLYLRGPPPSESKPIIKKKLHESIKLKDIVQRHEEYKTAHKRAVRLDRHSMDNNRGGMVTWGIRLWFDEEKVNGRGEEMRERWFVCLFGCGWKLSLQIKSEFKWLREFLNFQCTDLFMVKLVNLAFFTPKQLVMEKFSSVQFRGEFLWT